MYALGVLLYELLTGTTPVDRKSLKAAALLEVLRIVREVEPPRPSAKLSSSATLPSIAAARRTGPARLSAPMKGELDWIVLKAMERDRARRYETANGLAADVLRPPGRRAGAGGTAQHRLPAAEVRPQEPGAGGRDSRGILRVVGRGRRYDAGNGTGRKRARRPRLNSGEAEVARAAEAEQSAGPKSSRQAEAGQRAKAEQKEGESAAVLKFVEDKVFAAGRPQGQEGGLGKDVRLTDALKAAVPNIKKLVRPATFHQSAGADDARQIVRLPGGCPIRGTAIQHGATIILGPSRSQPPRHAQEYEQCRQQLWRTRPLTGGSEIA